MSSAGSFILMQIKVIFIRMVSHLGSLWNRGTRELGNGLLENDRQTIEKKMKNGEEGLRSTRLRINWFSKATFTIWLLKKKGQSNSI